MTYQESLDYLYSRLPMFQRVGAQAIKNDLTNTLKLLEALGNPETAFRSIHVAGTNGKGTSAHTLAAIIQSAGYRTGLYTSPHFKSFTERARFNGQEIPPEFVSHFVTAHQGLIETINPSFFEVTVAMAFQYFKEMQVDVAVIETGLGGRLDSTNVITPMVSLITMIGWDHADLLGNTLEAIAKEKAGIIKKNVPVVIGANQPELLPVFGQRAGELNASLFTTNAIQAEMISQTYQSQHLRVTDPDHSQALNIETDITAAYFQLNIPGILKTLDVLQDQLTIPESAVLAGFKAIKSLTGIKGRWQILQEKPMLVADMSHNEPGFVALFEQVNQVKYEQLHIVFGAVRDKDLNRIFHLLPQDARYYWTAATVPRALPVQELHQMAAQLGFEGDSCANVNDAIKLAKKNASEQDFILVCGSTFVVAEIEDL